MGKKVDFFKNTGGKIVKTSGKAVKTCLFVAIAGLALGLGLNVVGGGST